MVFLTLRKREVERSETTQTGEFNISEERKMSGET